MQLGNGILMPIIRIRLLPLELTQTLRTSSLRISWIQLCVKDIISKTALTIAHLPRGA